jgi:hypothetical protein
MFRSQLTRAGLPKFTFSKLSGKKIPPGLLPYGNLPLTVDGQR